ncbi:MAG: cation diffusion facilitator family transporter [Myxococcota bacterium]
MAHSHGHTMGIGTAREARGDHARRILVVAILSALYVVVEVVGGLWSGSLALLADAGHTLSDVGALTLSLVAIWIAKHPATKRRTFGHTRAEILAALAQGVGLLVVAIFVSIEAIERFGAPREVSAGVMIVVASGGLAMNAFGLWWLRQGRHENLNLRGAWLHIASDALGSIGVIVAGIAIEAYGWTWIDPAASLLISALIVYAAVFLLRDVVDVLMESAPAHLDTDEIRGQLLAEPGVLEIHDLHVWSIGSGEVSLSCHAIGSADFEAGDLLRRLQQRLRGSFGIEHATLQLEPEAGAEVCAANCEPEDSPST